LAFGTRATIIATTAFVASGTSATTAASAASTTVGSAFAAILTAGAVTAAVGRADFIAGIGVLEVRVARTPALAAVTAPITSTTAATAVASIAAVFALTARLATVTGGGSCGRFLSAEEALEPTEETAGFFHRCGFFPERGTVGAIRTFAAAGASAAVLVGLVRARLECTVVAARLTGSPGVEGLRLAGVRGTGVGRTGVPVIAVAAATAFRAERRTIFAARGLGGGVAGSGGRSFPIHCDAFLTALGRENV